MEFYRVSWDEVTQMTRLLAMKVQGKRLWGIKRGGLVVSIMMAYHGCELADTLESCEVVIDDIVCTGDTLKACARPSAVLVVRHGCNYIPTWWVMMLRTKEYILFPWEDEEVVDTQLGFRTRDS